MNNISNYPYKYSANTGYLWKELTFIERIHKAAEYKFDAVEFHDEAQNCDLSHLNDVLMKTGLPVLCLNTRMANSAGCAAIPGRENEARQDIDAAIEIASRIKSGAIHVLAGKSKGKASRNTYCENLKYALMNSDFDIFIEPVSYAAINGYYLNSIKAASGIIKEIGHPRLKIMFDCFHIRHEFENLAHAFQDYQKLIGHIQIASFPDRNEPENGIINYSNFLKYINDLGYQGYFGCEYNPETSVENGLNWRETV